METKDLHELKGNARNPRRISDFKATGLQNSMDRFGDLSGIVFNARLQRLVGGHQRTALWKKIQAQAKVYIAQRLDQPDSVGTIAIGWVIVNGKHFSYREVDWDDATDMAANLAANNLGGEFDDDGLAEIIYELSQDEDGDELLALTGFSQKELDEVLGDDAADEKAVEKKSPSLSVKLTDSQLETVKRAIAIAKTMESFAGEENKDFDGNALHFICADFLANHDTIGA